MGSQNNNSKIINIINDNSFSNQIKKIYYSNIIAQRTSEFTLEEEKIIHLIFSQIKPFQKNDTTIKLNKVYFFEKLGLTGDDKYKRYNILLKKIRLKSSIIIETEKNIRDGFFIIGSNWYKHEPYFEVDLNPKFMPFIEQLKDNYAKIDLDSVCAFSSKYSLIIYKWLCSWTDENKKINQRYETTKSLKGLLGLSKESYVENGKFKRSKFEKYTINKAIDEINELSDLTVSYKKIKNGVKVKHYQFDWQPKEHRNIKPEKVKTNEKIEVKQQTLQERNKEINELLKVKKEKKSIEQINTKRVIKKELNSNKTIIQFSDEQIQKILEDFDKH